MIQKINGIVVHGKKLGRTIGIPTANIELSNTSNICPGVYKINIIISGEVFHGVGTHLVGSNIFESYIFFFSRDIYGQEIQIVLLKKLRENKKFESLLDLKSAIQEDISKTKNTCFTVLTFGAFDYIHEGHKYYLYEAKKYADFLVTIVARDTNIEKIKGKKPLYNEQKRLEDVKNMNISDEIILGDEENPMKWLDIYKPQVICLGYDQRGFVGKLSIALTQRNMQTEIITISALKPEIYKSSLLKIL